MSDDTQRNLLLALGVVLTVLILGALAYIFVSNMGGEEIPVTTSPPQVEREVDSYAAWLQCIEDSGGFPDPNETFKKYGAAEDDPYGFDLDPETRAAAEDEVDAVQEEFNEYKRECDYEHGYR